MQVKIKSHRISLTDKETEYIRQKMEALTHFDIRVDDPASIAKLRVEKTDLKTTNRTVNVKVNLTVPNARMSSEVTGLTVFESVDILEDKLKKQIEKYKTKRLHR